MKRLTLITISYNDVSALKSTYQSVCQRPDWVDWIVIDGGSKDGSKEFLESNDDVLTYWLSEPDKGISDAFNKGIECCESGYIMFLNSGDSIKPDFFLNAKKIIEKISLSNNRVAIARVDFGGRVVGCKASARMQKKRNYLPHQGMIIERALFDEIGLYDVNFKLGMDYEWSLRLIDLWDNLYFSKDVLVYMDPDGLSVNNYVDTYCSYHLARKKNRISNYFFSLLISGFFIGKHFVSSLFKRVVS